MTAFKYIYLVRSQYGNDFYKLIIIIKFLLLILSL